VPVELAEILHPMLSNGKTPKTGGGVANLKRHYGTVRTIQYSPKGQRS